MHPPPCRLIYISQESAVLSLWLVCLLFFSWSITCLKISIMVPINQRAYSICLKQTDTPDKNCNRPGLARFIFWAQLRWIGSLLFKNSRVRESSKIISTQSTRLFQDLNSMTGMLRFSWTRQAHKLNEVSSCHSKRRLNNLLKSIFTKPYGIIF